jgi:hypothetical protein
MISCLVAVLSLQAVAMVVAVAAVVVVPQSAIGAEAVQAAMAGQVGSAFQAMRVLEAADLQEDRAESGLLLEEQAIAMGAAVARPAVGAAMGGLEAMVRPVP